MTADAFEGTAALEESMTEEPRKAATVGAAPTRLRCSRALCRVIRRRSGTPLWPPTDPSAPGAPSEPPGA